jgi:APA family basic amino acid/polyamine antiporter
MPITRPPAEPALLRSLRLPHATAMVVGTIIGASIFVQPSEITGAVPSIPGLLAAWTVAGLLTIAGALICAELSSAFPRTGGVYVFLNETLSPAVGFLWAWAMFWSMHSGIIAAIAVIFARYVGFFVPLSAMGLRVTAIVAILVLSAINYVGVRQGSRLQATFTLGKLAAILVIIVVGFAFGSHLPHFVGAGTPPDLARQFPRAVAAGLFAFGGWHMVTYVAGETVEARRTIPTALMIGTAIVTVCYVALNVVYLYVLPLGRVMASTRVAADAADAVLGAGGGAAMSALVVFSTFGALSGIVLLGPRVYFSMADDNRALAWLGAVHPRFRTPHRAIFVQAIWASVLVATGTYRALFTRVVYTEWIFFALMAVGLFVARRRPDYNPRYRMPGYPIVPAVFTAVSAAIALNQLVSNLSEALIGLLLVGVGLPAYYLGRRIEGRGATAGQSND